MEQLYVRFCHWRQFIELFAWVSGLNSNRQPGIKDPPSRRKTAVAHFRFRTRKKKKWRRSENFPQDTHTLAGETCENFSSCVATWKHESTPPQEWVGGLVGCWVGWLYVALRGTWQILRFTFWKISNTKLNLMRTRNICVRAAFHLGAICKTSRHRHRHRHPP